MGLFFALALVAGQVKHLILRPFYDSTPMHFRPETMHRRVFIACYEIDVGIFFCSQPKCLFSSNDITGPLHDPVTW